MTYWEKVKQDNFIFYQTIKNSVSNKKLAHSFILTSQGKQDLDIEWKFIVESIIAKNPFTKEEVNIDNFADLHLIDGTNELIKRESVSQKLDILKQTALTAQGIKVLIIKNIDNANKQSLNSLLKFIEEPPANTYIIMTTIKLQNVLNTIKSRSQIIFINAHSLKTRIEYFTEQKLPFPKICAYAFANKLDIQDLKNLKTNIQNVKKIFDEGIKNNNTIINNVFKYLLKKNILDMLSIINVFLTDIWRNSINKAIAFDDLGLLNKYVKFNFKKAINEVSTINFKLSKNINLTTLLPVFALNLKDCYE